MIFGFVLIVTLLSIAIKKNMNSETGIQTGKINIPKNNHLLSVTYSSDFTVLVILDADNEQILRIISNKTGKILSNKLISDLINRDSEK